MEKVFTSNSTKGIRILAALITSLLFGVIATVAVAYISIKIFDDASRIISYLSVGVGIVTAIAIFASSMKKYEYVVDENGVIIRNRRKNLHEFPFDKYAISSLVTRHYTNGVYTGSTYSIKAFNLETEKEKSVRCSLSKDNFNSFMSYVNNYSHPNKSTGADAIIERPDIEMEFTPKKDKVKSRRVKKNLFLTVFVAQLAGGFLIAAGQLVLGVVAIIAIILIYVLFALSSANKALETVPDRIIVNKNGIAIDDRMYPYDNIERTVFTPGSGYGNGYRTGQINLINGEKITLWLGESSQKDLFLSNYDEMIKIIETMFVNDPGKFMLDL